MKHDVIYIYTLEYNTHDETSIAHVYTVHPHRLAFFFSLTQTQFLYLSLACVHHTHTPYLFILHHFPQCQLFLPFSLLFSFLISPTSSSFSVSQLQLIPTPAFFGIWQRTAFRSGGRTSVRLFTTVSLQYSECTTPTSTVPFVGTVCYTMMMMMMCHRHKTKREKVWPQFALTVVVVGVFLPLPILRSHYTNRITDCC